MRKIFLAFCFMLLFACKKENYDLNDNNIYKWRRTITIDQSSIRNYWWDAQSKKKAAEIEISPNKKISIWFDNSNHLSTPLVDYVFYTNQQVKDLEDKMRQHSNRTYMGIRLIINYEKVGKQ